jgi:putative ABC transport system substrate-binding protein
LCHNIKKQDTEYIEESANIGIAVESYEDINFIKYHYKKRGKIMKKKMLTVVMSVVCAMSLVAGCGNASTTKKSDSSASSTESASGASYTIGISQFAEHPSLDNCRKGFLDGLKSAGIVEGKNLKVDYQNAQTDTGTASTISDSFVSAKVNMICAIATPSAASAYNSCMNANIPVIYTAVSDPVAAGLAKKDGSSAGNITGSSDVLPVEEQLKMIRKMLPNAKKIGILYTTSEANSSSTIAEYKKLADKYNFEIVDSGINTAADIELAATNLVSKVDCLCNLTDNTVVSALQTVLDKANAAKIPVFGSEIEQVKSGCVASMGIDYYKLGVETGTMAAKILKGEASAKDTPFIKASSAELYVNTAAAEKVGLTIDKDYTKNAAQVFDQITVK